MERDDERVRREEGLPLQGRATSEVSEAFALALLPVIHARLERARRFFQRAAETLEHGEEGEKESMLEILGKVQDESRLLGWSLGVVAAARGSNVLRARREAGGLAWLVDMVEEAVCVAFEPNPADLPTTRPGVAEGWELPFALAHGFLCAARNPGDEPPPATMRWRIDTVGDEARLVFLDREPARARLMRALEELGSLLPGLEPCDHPEGPAVRLPAAWLGPPTELPPC